MSRNHNGNQQCQKSTSGWSGVALGRGFYGTRYQVEFLKGGKRSRRYLTHRERTDVKDPLQLFCPTANSCATNKSVHWITKSKASRQPSSLTNQRNVNPHRYLNRDQRDSHERLVQLLVQRVRVLLKVDWRIKYEPHTMFQHGSELLLREGKQQFSDTYRKMLASAVRMLGVALDRGKCSVRHYRRRVPNKPKSTPTSVDTFSLTITPSDPNCIFVHIILSNASTEFICLERVSGCPVWTLPCRSFTKTEFHSVDFDHILLRRFGIHTQQFARLCKLLCVNATSQHAVIEILLEPTGMPPAAAATSTSPST
eukprot:m.32043 g.32043  ORF g.32043 m.32043 type:complete len:311 (-) comp16569_c2_seq1:116-1048(-)